VAAPAPQAPQSVFLPASSGADLLSDLSIALIAGATLIFAGVMALLWFSVRSRGAREVDGQRWIVAGGIVLPVAVLTVLLAAGLAIGSRLSHGAGIEALEVEVVARRWWWELRYRTPDGRGFIVTANELHLPTDCKVTLTLLSGDVIHSFWVPALGGKVDTIPGHRNRLAVHATRPGRWRGQCAEYCGTQHANMSMEVVVESPTAFRQWLMNEAAPAPGAALEPADAVGRRGLRVFLDSGCATCHAVRGTTAAGTLGPDLTHLASRRTIAAATLPNTPAMLAAWIPGAQHLKEGNLMPSMPVLGEDLDALVAWLGALH
jgi:cytochrome c oxidase subunit 2